MRDFSLLIWLTQLGLSVACPLAGCVLLAVWLHRRFSMGIWIIVTGIILGLILAIDGLRASLKAMERMNRRKEDEQPPPVSFNDHD